MVNEIVPGDGLEKIAPLLKEVYQEALIEQLRNDNKVYASIFASDPEREARVAEWKAKHEKERKELLDLLAKATGPVKAIVELHSVDKYDECQGCDFGGYEGDKPGWPCRTIDLIAEELRGQN